MIVEKLRISTSGFHRLAEELNFSQQLMNSTISSDEYSILLKRLHTFFRQAKKLADNYPEDNIVPGYLFAEKIHLLETDLKQAGSETFEEGRVFSKLGYYNYLGFSYVPLGSMLGGQLISKKMAGSKSTFPNSFYESCKSTMSSWQEFTGMLQTVSEQHHNDIINGARIAYLYFIYLCTAIN